jgi:hypothetical protein
MKHILLLTIACALLITSSFGQKISNQNLTKLSWQQQPKGISNIPIVGCYSDTVLIENEELVVGNGFLTIKKVNKRYIATFSELASDGGESHPDVTVRNLVVNEPKRTIVFDLPLHSGMVLRNVKGQISRKGLKLNWGNGTAAEYGQPNPFMRRKKCPL